MITIIDDYAYLNGISINVSPYQLKKYPYIIILGDRGIGKSVFSKIMSQYNRNVIYISFQRLDDIYFTFKDKKDFIKDSLDIILISKLPKFKVNDIKGDIKDA